MPALGGVGGVGGRRLAPTPLVVTLPDDHDSTFQSVEHGAAAVAVSPPPPTTFARDLRGQRGPERRIAASAHFTLTDAVAPAEPTDPPSLGAPRASGSPKGHVRCSRPRPVGCFPSKGDAVPRCRPRRHGHVAQSGPRQGREAWSAAIAICGPTARMERPAALAGASRFPGPCQTSISKPAREVARAIVPCGIPVAQRCYHRGMGRVRISTTVDELLLEDARRTREGKPDSVVIDDALTALLARHRSARVDAAYSAYDEHPLAEPDEWGDLATFREAAGAS